MSAFSGDANSDSRFSFNGESEFATPGEISRWESAAPTHSQCDFKSRRE